MSDQTLNVWGNRSRNLQMMSTLIYEVAQWGLPNKGGHGCAVRAKLTFPELHKFGVVRIGWTSVYLGLG